MGAALSSMGRSVPSLAMRTVWFAKPTTKPSRNALVAGFFVVMTVPLARFTDWLQRRYAERERAGVR